MKQFIRIKLLPLLILISVWGNLLLLPSMAAESEAETVTVTGRGEVYAPADAAEISFSLEGRGVSPNDATEKAEELRKTVENCVSSRGTLRLESHCAFKDYTTGAHCVSQYYTLSVDKPKETPSLAEKLIEAGASCVNPPCYLLKNSREWEAKALTAALADAEERAKLCGAGERLISLRDGGSNLCFCCGNEDGTVTVVCTVTLTYRR